MTSFCFADFSLNVRHQIAFNLKKHNFILAVLYVYHGFGRSYFSSFKNVLVGISRTFSKFCHLLPDVNAPSWYSLFRRDTRYHTLIIAQFIAASFLTTLCVLTNSISKRKMSSINSSVFLSAEVNPDSRPRQRRVAPAPSGTNTRPPCLPGPRLRRLPPRRRPGPRRPRPSARPVPSEAARTPRRRNCNMMWSARHSTDKGKEQSWPIRCAGLSSFF